MAATTIKTVGSSGSIKQTGVPYTVGKVIRIREPKVFEDSTADALIITDERTYSLNISDGVYINVDDTNPANKFAGTPEELIDAIGAVFQQANMRPGDPVSAATITQTEDREFVTAEEHETYNTFAESLAGLSQIVLANVTALKDYDDTTKQVKLLGKTAANDGFSAEYYWDAANTDTDNSGTIATIVARTVGGTGRWLSVGYNPSVTGAAQVRSALDSNADGKVNAADSADNVEWTGVLNKPSTFTPATHTHAQSEITGLVGELAAKATPAQITAAIDALKAGVSASGDTLSKLYSLIVSSFTEVTVASISARNAYNVTSLPLNIFVQDDGDGNWALYKATTTGVGASFTKLSDYDVLNSSQTASQIKTAYESNLDTNAFTDAFKAIVMATSGTNTGDETNTSIKTKLANDVYQNLTVATKAAAVTAATGAQWKIIKVTADETDGGATNRYFYEGVAGVLELIF